MFLNNIFQFLKGYVILLVDGASIGHFLNVCMHRNIHIRNIRVKDNKATLSVSASDFKRMRPIVRKTHVRVHIIKKVGLYQWVRGYRKRIFFLSGIFIFVALIFLSDLFIWKINIVGTENKEEIKNAAEIAGVRIGAYRPFLPEGNELKNIILNNVDGYTWAWVYFKGGMVTVEVREKIMPPKMIDKKTPCDIIALRDGVITDMTIKKGNAFCTRGDVVLRGDLLVGGTLTDQEGNFRLEHSLGEVYALTRHKAVGQIKLFREVRESGNGKKTYFDLKLFSKEIPLYRRVNIPFEEYSIKYGELRLGSWSGILLKSYCYTEEMVHKIPVSEEMAVEAVKRELEKDIAQNLLPGSVLKNEEISYTKIDDETIEVSLVMEFIEQIGAEVVLGYTEE